MSDASASPAAGLSAATGLAEQGFLAAGQCLEQAVAILDRLSQRFASYLGELTGEALGDTRRDLASAGVHVAALAEARGADAAALDALNDIVAAAGRGIAALLPVPREVANLSLNARVVAGGMGDAGADFAVFAGDIRRAAESAHACLEGARAALGQVGQDVAAARADAAAFAQRHGGAMATIPTRLAANLRSLAVRQQLAGDAANAAQHQSEQVRDRVAEQIFALQLGDITRQRLEHVQAAAQLTADAGCHAGDLLAAQLNDTADELIREGERIEAGLRQLTAAARAIGKLGVEVHGEAMAGGFLTALEADIRQTATLFAELESSDASTDQRMVAVLGAANSLADRLANVQSVQEDIRIMGLNATLKCGRLGTMGRALAAIAQELRLCSAQFGTKAALVLHDLDRLRPIAVRLSEQSLHTKHAELAQAADNMLAPLHRLGRLEHDLTEALSQLQADAGEVGQWVDDAVEQFAVRHVLSATLRRVADAFAACGSAANCGRDVLDRIAAGYTMAREREVHAGFAPLPQAASAATDEFADVLF